MRLRRLCRRTIKYIKSIKFLVKVYFAGLLLGAISSIKLDFFNIKECSRPLANSLIKDKTFIEENVYELKILQPNQSNFDPIKRPAINRPYFASTELGIKEKLLIAVLSSAESLNTLGAAINKTIGSSQAKVVYFVDKKPSSLPTGILLVNFDDGFRHLLPLNVLKYVITQLANSYDFFLFISDKGYFQTEKILDFVSHISNNRKIYLGSPAASKAIPISCALEGGVLVSRYVLSEVNRSLNWCIENCNNKDQSVNFGVCLHHATGQQCQNVTGSLVYASYHVLNLNYDKDIGGLKTLKFNSSFSVFPVTDNITFYKLHRYFCEVRLHETKRLIESIKEDIYNISQYLPAESYSISWPIGSPETYKPKNQFDAINWVYFTETQIFAQDESTTVKELIGIDKLDIQNIIRVAVDKLNEIYNNTFLYSHLINGYRRFDPMRGMEYALDIALIRENKKHFYNSSLIIKKRLHLVRPLGEVESVPMPHVTDSSAINIILTIRSNEQESCIMFLEQFSHIQETTTNNSLFLIIVFMYEQHAQSKSEDKFSVVKSMLPYYDSKSKHGIATKVINFVGNGSFVPEFKIIDMVSEMLEPDAIMLTCSVGMLLNTEMLNRVRINTIPGWQVFFPIGFWQYKPNIIYDKKPYPTEIEFSSRTGHYDVLSYEHGSFYNSDYKDARKSLSMEELMKCDLYETFVRYGKIHIFRAVEPEFKHYYVQLECSSQFPDHLYKRCLERKSLNLASKALLAKRIFQYQAKRQKQNTTQN